jgi:hypothetical protein
MPKIIDLTGQKYQRLTVIKFVELSKYGAIWECKCDCGNIKNVKSGDLRSGNTNSCGCYMKDRIKETNTKHKATENGIITGTYRSWRTMKARCYQKSTINYKEYGGRGIEVCERWRNSFENFLEDMGERPEGYSIERKDFNGNYEPSNCCWIPFNHQSKNTRSNKYVILNGEKMIQSEASRLLNIPQRTISEWRKRQNCIPENISLIYIQ